MANAFAIPTWVSGVVVALGIGLIIVGGIKRIGLAVQMIVPVMAVGYMLVALVVIAMNITEIPAAFGLIFRSAFGMEATYGGIVGSAIAFGVKRGIYSNEAGQGTAPMAAAAAEVEHPAQQGLVQAFSIYFDTWMVCTATALMIISTGSYNVLDGAGGFLREQLPGITDGPAYTQVAVDSVIPNFGGAFVAIALLFFAFTTTLAYYYYTENNVAYLIPEKSKWRKPAYAVVKLAFLGGVVFGAVNSASLVWQLGDIGVGLMAWVNIIAILILTKPAIRCLRHYEAQLKAGKEPSFKGSDIGLEDLDHWN